MAKPNKAETGGQSKNDDYALYPSDDTAASIRGIGGGHGPTQRRLQNYHISMIGFCSGIGTGLFVGTGSAYAKAGPAGLLLAYAVVGAVLWCVMQSIAELATLVRRYTPFQK